MKAAIGSSIGRKIVGALLAIYLLTYGLTAAVVYTGVHRSLLDSAEGGLAQVADLKYQRLCNRMDELATDLTAWAQLEVMNDLVSGDVDRRIGTTLEALQRLYGLAGGIYAFDAGGALIADADGDDGAPPRGTRLPAAWTVTAHGVTFFDKHRNPLGGGDVVALAIPIFGSFAPDYRVGTLVIALPWTMVETLLSGVEPRTVLVRRPPHPAVLSSAADPDMDRESHITGRSVQRDGLLRSWQVVVSQPMSVVTRPLRRVALELALLGILLAAPIFAFVRWMGRRLTAPIMELTRAVRVIADTDQLDIQVPVTSQDELGFLARSFNRMTASLRNARAERDRSMRDLEHLNLTLEGKVADRTAELEAAVTAQRRLISDISHEIKSPLARLSMALGLARRQVEPQAPRHFDRMEQEIAAVAALASELLTLARLEGAAAGLQRAPVDLPDLLRAIIADAAYERPDRQRDLALVVAPDLPDGGVLPGNADLLRRAIENVIRNALFYTTAGVQVTVTLATPAANAPTGLSLTVADRGPGVSDDAIGQLFDPFYRADPARARDTGGTGIGLTICKRVVELHGGAVRATHNHPTGLVVEITLPAMPHTPQN
ncbi:signal transduction histidine kinase [Nitrospirillum amazonense]|uniref:histidine kinase n=1 Tax=Nitrospirillum amazonense TaxID=28077 RepID=A0A560JHM7_9PROT|nr:ATP-binding protein [Nitrospirillum amazonense]TWB70691.1 signal transduction histidine kinase [Nitrospirillum amazonense]